MAQILNFLHKLIAFNLHLNLFFFCALTGHAAELRLSNGDKITGDFLRRADGKIYFRSPLLGEIAVLETQAVVIESPVTPVESLAGLPPAQPQPKPAPAAVSSNPKSKNTPWRGQIEFGYQQKSGRQDAVSISLRAGAERTSGDNNYKADARSLYGEQNDKPNSDRYDGSFRWRHELSKRVFGQTLTSYTRDRIKLIEHNVEQNAGFGYRLYDRPRHKANVGAGLTAQYRETADLIEETSYFGEFFQDYTYRISGRLTITQDSSVLYSPDERSSFQVINNQAVSTNKEAENYRFRFNTALQGKLTERVSLNFRYEYEYDNTILDPNAKIDQRISSTIAYGF
jgi:putative salt-induced outer membrane protein YdiY